MMIFSESEGNGEGSGVLLAGDLRILEALTSIRDKILDVASSEPIATRPRPTGSASETAEDAILTAQMLWRSVQLIHENTHGHISPADQVVAVARLAELILESARIKVKAWKGLADIDRRIDRILDGRETQSEASTRRETLRKASRKFALLTSSQRHALQEAWLPATKYKEIEGKKWKQVQRLSRSITSLSPLKRRRAQKTVAEAQSESPLQPTEYSIVHELPAKGESKPIVQLRASEQWLSAKAPSNATPRVLNDEQNDQPNELFSRQASSLTESPRLFLDGEEDLSQDGYDVEELMAMDDYTSPGGELRYLEKSSSPGSWADVSTGAPPGPRWKADDGKPQHRFHAYNMWDSDDYIERATCPGGETHYEPQGITPPIARPRTPDIVDDLLAQWTTLPR